jgi:SH3-like domain-containing protein
VRLPAVGALASLLAGALAFPALAQPDCARLQQHAQDIQPALPSPRAGVVIASGRTAFHSGPDASCQRKQLFVIRGDALTVYRQWNGWMQVRYRARDGQAYDTWVAGERVQLQPGLTRAP